MRRPIGLLLVLAALTFCALPPGEEMAGRDEAYGAAKALVAEGLYGEAEAAFRRAIAADPGFAPAWTDLANLQAKLGQLAGAEVGYMKAIAADSAYVRAYHNLSVVYADQFRFREAIELLQAARRRRPDYAPVLETMGLFYGRLGANDKAETALESALVADSSRVKARRRLGRLYTERRRYVEAEQLLVATTRLAPDQSASWLVLGQLYLDWNRPQEAIAALEEAVRIDSSQVEAHYSLARGLLSTGRRQEGQKVMVRFTRLSEHATQVEQLRSRLEAAEKRADEIDTRLMLAFHYRKMGAVDRALTQLHAILAVAPDHLEALIRLSSQYLRSADMKRAAALCRRGIGAHPDRPEAAKLYHTLGFIHLSEQRLTEARVGLQRAVELEPGLAKAWGHLGYVHALSGNRSGAADAYARAVEADPTSAEAHFNLGHIKTGFDPEAARRHYRDALAADSSYARAHLALGLLYENSDSLAAAAQSYRAFLGDWQGDVEGERMARARLEKLGERGR